MAREYLSNLPTPGSVTPLSTLETELKTGETTVKLVAAVPAAFQEEGIQFRLICGSEILLVTKVAGAGKTLTVTRAAESSTEANHVAGASVFNFITKEALEKWVAEQAPLTVGKASVYAETSINAEHEVSSEKSAVVYLTLKGSNGETEWEADVLVDGVKINRMYNKNVRSQDEFETETFIVPKGKKWEVKVTGAGVLEVKAFESHAFIEGGTGPQGVVGPRGLTGTGNIAWQKEWKAGVTYKVNDAVFWKGSSYLCILEHSSHEPPNETYWGLLAEGASSAGELGVGAYAFTETTFNEEHEPSAAHATLVALTITWKNAEQLWKIEVIVDGKTVAKGFQKDIRTDTEEWPITILVPKGKKYEVKQTGTITEGKLFAGVSVLQVEAKTGAIGPEGLPGTGNIRWRGEWKTATLYKENDGVEWKGSSYICIKEHESHEPPNATYWGLLAKAGAEGKEGKSGGLEKYESFHAAEQSEMATGAFISAAEPDKVSFVLAEASPVVVYAAFLIAEPGAGVNHAGLFIDGVLAHNESAGGFVEGQHSPGTFLLMVLVKSSAGATTFVDTGAEEGKTKGLGDSFNVFLAAGAHEIEIKYKPEGANKIKERRLIALVL